MNRSGTNLADFLMQAFAALFLAILFLQSGIDKVIDRKGNLEWLTGHFAKSPLKGMVPAMLGTITVIEVSAGLLSAVGVLQLLLFREHVIAFWGAVVATLGLCALFFGQRMAKDYAGAAGLVPYFLTALAAMYLCR